MWMQLGDVMARVLGMEYTFETVPNERVSEFLSKGWELADDLVGTRHEGRAVLMLWVG